MSRAGDVIVEEGRWRHHSKSPIEQHVDIRQVAIECVSAFDAEKSGGYPGFSLAAFEVARQTCAGLDQHQLTSRTLRKLMQVAGLMERSLLEAAPGPERPPLSQ